MNKRPLFSRNWDLRLVISGCALIALAVFFWTQSRYPALNEKAIMGGDTPMSGLSFDIILDIFPNSPIWWEIIANIANWIFTNLKGMTFGVLFGAAMLTLLSVIKKKSFESGFANAALGAVIGAPLGVCVNCAAPIALGLHMGRMRLETTLSALIASPTLNVIVVTMSFSLLPFHVAGAKLLLSLLMVLLIIPLLCKYWLKEETAASGNNMSALSKVSQAKGLSGWIAKALAPREYEQHQGGFFNALIWYAKVFGRNLFYIAIITVPMMFVAAILGALIASWADTDALRFLLPTTGALKIILAMALLVAVATFAPAPIALDIILTAVLLGIGLGTEYAAAILIALGTFSIYAFIILWRAISLKAALTIWVATMALAMTGGIIAKLTAKYERAYYQERTEQYLATAPPLQFPKVPDLPKALSIASLQPAINAQRIIAQDIAVSVTGDNGTNARNSIKVSKSPVAASTTSSIEADASSAFTRIPGQKIGLIELGVNHPLREFAPAIIQGGIAAGDIHGDGWIDVITRRPTGANGLSIYSNIGGTFQRQDMALGPVMQSWVTNMALADLDNDGQLDLIVSTRFDGLFLFFNQGGFFDEKESLHLKREAFEIIMSLAFADMDQDGDLDILLGSWADGTGTEGWASGPPELSTNKILWNNGDRQFEEAKLPGSAGQTLTMLVSDFNNDGIDDLLKGDDVARTDQVIRFSGGRDIPPVTAEMQPFEYFLRTSMSYDVGDWNNDLRRDYYGGQIANDRATSREASRGDGRILEICQQFGRDNGWDIARVRACAIDLKSIDQIRGGKSSTGNVNCNITQRQTDTSLCFAMEYHRQLIKAVHKRGTLDKDAARNKCLSSFKRMPFMQQYCGAYNVKISKRLSRDQLKKEHAPAIVDRNILMTAQENGGFVDDAGDQNVDFPGWTWNSRFTDLDQDGWQDLLVMTGIWLSPSKSTTNIFYHNDNGSFKDATNAFGFTDVVPSYSYVGFDYDRDGDIDIIRDASASRMIVHRNDRPAGKSLWVHLRDSKGNSMGIGATITICTGGTTNVKRGPCQMRDIKASGGYQSFDPIAAHFGLGDKSVSYIQVRWPDGEISNAVPQEVLSEGEITVSR